MAGRTVLVDALSPPEVLIREAVGVQPADDPGRGRVLAGSEGWVVEVGVEDDSAVGGGQAAWLGLHLRDQL